MRIEIERLSHEGRGLARIGGKVVFVGGALPGETVEAELHQHHRRHDEYRLIQVIDAASTRVTPPCPLVGRCGGCDLQHLSADAQTRHKTEVALELLQRSTGLVPGQLDPPLESEAFGYRRRARLAVHVPHRGGTPSVGFRQEQGRRVITLEQCAVLEPALMALPARLQDVVRRFRRPAALGHLELTVSETADGFDDPVVHVHAAAELDRRDQARLTDLAVSESAYLTLQVRDRELEYLHRPRAEAPGYRLPDFDLRIGFQPGDFLQGNRAVNRALVARVVEWLDEHRGRRLLDAFAGLGNFSLPLARRGFDVVGMDVVPEMVARATRNAEVNQVGNARFEARDLHRPIDPPAFHDLDAAVLDPPRAGAHLLVRALAAQRLETILYVSCQPAALARDAAVLAEAGYELSRLALVDMFPQTSQIETMSLFTRRPRAARRGRAPATGT